MHLMYIETSLTMERRFV